MASTMADTKRSRSRWCVLTIKLLLLLLSKPCKSVGVNGRLATFTPTCPSSRVWSSRSSSSSVGVGLSIGDNPSPTFYDILGISSSSSQSEIKARYRSLMREIHPDANRDNSNNQVSTEEFTRVTEAYSTLSDPKLRLRYDRSLTVQQVSGTVQQVSGAFGALLKTAIPIIKQTAIGVEDVGGRVVRAGEILLEKGEAAGEKMRERGEVASYRLKVEGKMKELEQKASKEEYRASAIRTDIAKISVKRLPILHTSTESLSSSASITIFDSFLSTDRRIEPDSSNIPVSSRAAVLGNKDKNGPRLRSSDQIIANDIRVLTEMESKYTNGISDVRRKEKEVRTAEQAAQTALDVETRARRKLEEAQRELASATEVVKEKKKRLMEAEGEEKSAEHELKKMKGFLGRQVEKVRSKLKRREDTTMEREKLWMENEIFRLEKEATVYRQEARDMEKKLEEIRIENVKRGGENSHLRP